MKNTTAGIIKIIIADDHPLCLQGSKTLFKDLPEIILLGEARNGEELIEISKELKPDVVITDIRMPGTDGINAAKQLKIACPDIKIIGLSMIDDYTLISEMIAAGAKGYLSKTASASEIITAIKTVYGGETYYCKETTFELTKILLSKTNKQAKRCGIPEFSEKEISIIKLICDGNLHKQIADKLNLSKRTVEWYRKQILEKLDSNNTASIFIYAVKNKIC